jgi:hypothetical protein
METHVLGALVRCFNTKFVITTTVEWSPLQIRLNVCLNSFWTPIRVDDILTELVIDNAVCMYEGRLNSSWTGGIAPLQCRGETVTVIEFCVRLGKSGSETLQLFRQVYGDDAMRPWKQSSEARNVEMMKRSKPPVPLSSLSLRQTVYSTFSRSGWSRSASLANGCTSKQRPSPHLPKVPTRSNKVSLRTFQTALVLWCVCKTCPVWPNNWKLFNNLWSTEFFARGSATSERSLRKTPHQVKQL